MQYIKYSLRYVAFYRVSIEDKFLPKTESKKIIYLPLWNFKMPSNFSNLTVLLAVLSLGASTAILPVVYNNMDKELKSQYLVLTTTCLTLVGTAYQTSKNNNNH
jgi:hypothetical protein